jgi:hypothetical protein
MPYCQTDRRRINYNAQINETHFDLSIVSLVCYIPWFSWHVGLGFNLPHMGIGFLTMAPGIFRWPLCGEALPRKRQEKVMRFLS